MRLNKYSQNESLEYFKENGYITKVMDSIVFVLGLENGRIYDLVEIDERYVGIILELGKNTVGIGIFDENANVNEMMEVKLLNQLAGLQITEKVGATVLDVLGNVQYGESEENLEDNVTEEKIYSDYFKIARPIMDIASVKRPLQTGWLMIDSMIPVGKGQRQLLLGNRQTGKTQIALNAIVNQKGRDVKCIYVSIGQKNVQIANVIEFLKKKGSFDYTTIVSSSAGDSLIAQYLAPYAGVALAEKLRDEGNDVLIVYDDLTKHADAYRAISLLLSRVPGREAYPGDTFYIHSSLLERAGQLNKDNGGGSITALPIIETLADDVASYIPSNVISITDGQIFLRSNLFASGQKPAVDVGISVSRVGSDAQLPLVKSLSKGLNLILSQYAELKELMMFDSDLDDEKLKLIHDGEILMELFKQNIHENYGDEFSCLLLFGFKEGMFDDLSKEKVILLKKQLYILFEKEEILQRTIAKELELSAISENTGKAIKTFYNKCLEGV
ncbi:F0F1 ATP synthase subunit alpha [Lactococcus garvieae]|uniref:ATP synthase subunit alpha n=1 Tax=Lactococcus garvieae TaxID=1363 RepID=A0AA46TVZ3_9LACT|nr:F0F1 ATP synthase subunit alpha [Lactococcus garvieae]UYT10309.1 F0F1 ATP synthase subunit alpha [Lactococcus garvieae]UYT12332.1 F0F1 ATP synthase subunit alpha [Lactococcus garvieae]